MNAHLKNAFGCIPFLAMEAKSRNQMDVWNWWPYFSPTPIFCQTVNPISTKGSWTPNLMFWKWMHILKMLLAAFPFLLWRPKVEIKWMYEIDDHILALPQFFAKQLTLSQPRGLGHQIWCFENESTFKKCCWLHSFLAMEAKSRNQKGIWNCWPGFSPAPIFLPKG